MVFRSPRVFRTASFRLAAVYALIFGLSAGVLAAVAYFTATAALDQQMRTRISADAELLDREYQSGGYARMMDAIRDRQRGQLAGGLDYTVFDARGRNLFGNLPHRPPAAGWQEMTGPPDGDEAPGELERLIVYALPLSDGGWLVVGDDVGKSEVLGRAILTTFAWMLLLVLTLAIAGGMVLSMAFLQRVDTITRTAEAIIGGDIQRRIPVRGAADDIDRLAVTLNRMLDRIASLMESLRQVSNDIAHDLRTPLGRLRQRLDEVRRNAGSVAEYETAVDHAVAETDDILDTFAALLRIAQIESGTRKAGFRSVDVSALTAHLCQTYLPVAEDARKTLDIGIAPGIAVDGDRELLVQMVANLIENAIRHTHDGTGIIFRLERCGPGAKIVVEDNGPGIPDNERERVLERFYRLERSRTTAGSGLGLSLVAAIAELHNAKVELVDANPGLRVSIVFAEVSLEQPAAELMRSAEAGFSSSAPFPRRARPSPGRSAAAT